MHVADKNRHLQESNEQRKKNEKLKKGGGGKLFPNQKYKSLTQLTKL